MRERRGPSVVGPRQHGWRLPRRRKRSRLSKREALDPVIAV